MSTSEQKNGFVLYHNYFNQIVLLSLEERGILFTAIFEYERNGQVTTEMPPTVAMAFSFIKDTLDRDREAYAAKCEQNAENGKKGGRPRKQTLLPKTERFFEKPKKADKDKDKDKDKEKDTDMDMDMDMEWDRDTRADAAASVGTDEGPLDGSAEDVPSYDESLVPCGVPSDVPSPAPRLCEEEWDFLMTKGIPEEYVTARLERAVTYSKGRNRKVVEILSEWWQTDRTRFPWNQRHAVAAVPSGLSPPASSFDTDDFFQAALNHSLREMGLGEMIKKGQRI